MVSKKTLLIVIIILLVLFVTSRVVAQEIEVNYPGKVSVDEEFSFTLTLIDFESDTYDVKIDILSGEDRIAKIENDGTWKSTFYYVNDAIQDNEGEFNLQITEDFDNADIIIRVRDSSDNVKSFEGYEIEKDGSSSSSAEEETSEEAVEEDFSEDFRQVSVISEPEEKEEISDIELTPKDIKTENNTESLSKSDYAQYGFMAFSAFVVLLVILKFSKKNKNEFR